MYDLQQTYWVFHEITVRTTCTKHAIQKEQATQFLKASALNTDTAIFDLKKQSIQGYVQSDSVCEHPVV
jgi:hypothetical protein